jgi:hypothetical protein
MTLKNAGIKSTREAVERMMKGEIFFCEGVKLFCDFTSHGNPFRCIYPTGESFSINSLFDDIADWQKEIQWEDDLANGPILCHVWSDDNRPTKLVRWIESFDEDGYICANSKCIFENATPVTADCLWNPDQAES